MVNRDSEEGAHWFPVRADDEVEELGSSLSAMHEVHELLASPDGRFLAVLSSGEGHPVLEVTDLEALRTQGAYVVLSEINPYPGSVGIDHWEGSTLHLESDIALTRRGEDGRLDASLLLARFEKFALVVDSGEIVPLASDDREIVGQSRD